MAAGPRTGRPGGGDLTNLYNCTLPRARLPQGSRAAAITHRREHSPRANRAATLRALRLVRSRAAEFGVDPKRIGVMGSSSGGRLAASASTLFDHPDGRTGAALDNSVSARPDFAVLVYPVITMTDPAAHVGSRRELLGEEPGPALLALMPLEQQVSAATPPPVLLHTQGDKPCRCRTASSYYQALTRAGMPAELYLFEQGGHGICLAEAGGGLVAAARLVRRGGAVRQPAQREDNPVLAVDECSDDPTKICAARSQRAWEPTLR